VIVAFVILLFGIFFGDYKKVKTRYKREKNITTIPEKDGEFSTCAGCTGTGCHK